MEDDKQDATKIIKIPKLRKRKDFLNWKVALESYLRAKELYHHLQYEIHQPALLLPESDSIDYQINVLKIPRDYEHYLKRIPLSHRETISHLMNRYPSYPVIFIHEDSEQLPDALYSLVSQVPVLQIADHIIPLVMNRIDYRKLKRRQIKDYESIFSITRSSLALEHVHLFPHNTPLHTAFRTLTQHFHKELHLEQTIILRKLENLPFRNLREYIANFEHLLCQYESVQGDRREKILHMYFMRNIPDRYRTSKSAYTGTSITEDLAYWRQLADREMTYSNREPNTSFQRSSSNHARNSLNKTKINTEVKHKINRITHTVIKPTNLKINKRCKKCGGFNHSYEQCPSDAECCFLCGSTSHRMVECHLKKKFIKAMHIDVIDDDTLDGHEILSSKNCNGEDDKMTVHTYDSQEDESTQPELIFDPTLDEDQAIGMLGIKCIHTRPRHSPSEECTCTCRFSTACIRPEIDSGASCHITGNIKILENTKEVPASSIENAFGKYSKITKAGELRLKLDNNIQITLPQVYYSSQVKGTYLSTAQLAKDNKIYTLCDDKGIHLMKDTNRFYTSKHENGAYILHCTNEFTSKETVKIDTAKIIVSPSIINHYRFGHVNYKYLKNAGLIQKDNSRFCYGCASGKLKARNYSKKIPQQSPNSIKPEHPFHKLHADTIGPFTRSYNKYKYITLVVDEYTKMQYPLLLHNKSEIPKKLLKLMTLLQRRYNTKIRSLRTDQGTEFVNSTLAGYLQKEGITHELSVPHEPTQNGFIERQVRTLKTTMRCLLHGGNLARYFWEYAALYAAHIWNSIPRKNTSESPHYKLHKTHPDLQRFRIFGSRGTSKPTSKQQLNRNRNIVFLGFHPTTNGYVVYDVRQRRVFNTRDIALDEEQVVLSANDRFHSDFSHTHKRQPSQTVTDSVTQERTIRETVEDSSIHLDIHDNDDTDHSVDANNSDRGNDATVQVSHPNTGHNTNNTTEHPTTQESIEDNSNTLETFNTDIIAGNTRDSNNSPPDYSEVSTNNILQYSRRQQGVHRLLQQQLYYLHTVAITKTTIPPKNYHSIKYRGDKDLWEAAYMKELMNLQQIGHMSVIDKPKNQEIIKLLELFVRKYDNINNKWIAKVRFVARGDLQATDKNFFSPVASQVALRLFIFMTVFLQFKQIRQLDISNAYIYGRLTDFIYIQLPQGHPAAKHKNKVWKTKCSIYGLQQSPAIWNNTIDEFLRKSGFCGLISDPCLYIYSPYPCYKPSLPTEDILQKSGERKLPKNPVTNAQQISMILLLYVDDILLAGRQDQVNSFITTLEQKFKVKGKEEANNFIGITLRQTGKKVILEQRKNIEEAVNKFKVQNMRRYSTPADISLKQQPQSHGEEDQRLLQDPKLFQSLIGTLRPELFQHMFQTGYFTHSVSAITGCQQTTYDRSESWSKVSYLFT